MQGQPLVRTAPQFPWLKRIYHGSHSLFIALQTFVNHHSTLMRNHSERANSATTSRCWLGYLWLPIITMA